MIAKKSRVTSLTRNIIPSCASRAHSCASSYHTHLRLGLSCHVLLTSAASTLGETWSLSSNARNINFLLYLAL